MAGLVNVDLGSAIKAGGNLLDDLFTSDEERDSIALEGRKIGSSERIGQMEVNKAEAQSGKAWRHWVGRVCAASLGLYFIPQYSIAAVLWCKVCWAVTAVDGVITLPPYPASPDAIMELVMGMLGLGTIKAAEKIMAPKQKPPAEKTGGFKWPWSKK